MLAPAQKTSAVEYRGTTTCLSLFYSSLGVHDSHAKDERRCYSALVEKHMGSLSSSQRRRRIRVGSHIS
jgi:hypothetical protein